MKISPLTYYVIGLSIAIAVCAFGFFWFWTPNMAEAKNFTEYGDALQIEANKKPFAIKRRDEAIAMVKERGAAWQDVVMRKTPPQSVRAGGIDLAVNRWQLTVDARLFRNNIQRAVNAQLRKGGVTVINGPEVPAFSTNATDIVETGFNYPAIEFPVVIYDFGTVTVQGTFKQICDHVEAWSRMPNYLAVADGLRFTGTSPVLTATYNLSMVAFIRGQKIAPSVPEGAGGSSATVGGAGGAPFGGPSAAPMGGPGGGRGPGRPSAAASPGGGPPPGGFGPGPRGGGTREEDI